MMTRTENNLDNEMEAGFPKRLIGAICKGYPPNRPQSEIDNMPGSQLHTV